MDFFSQVLRAAASAAPTARCTAPKMIRQHMAVAALASAPITIASSPSDSARWAVKVACDTERSPKSSSSSSSGAKPTDGGGTDEAVLEHFLADPALPFFLVDSHHASLVALHADKRCAPFAAQPEDTIGLVNWFDVAVADGAEAAVATEARQRLHWRTAVPIPIPTPKPLAGNAATPSVPLTYITALNQDGGAYNRDKLCGIVPHSVLLPSFGRSCCIPFFSVPSREALRSARDEAKACGGRVLVPELAADGAVCIALDREGTPFALYWRNDAWDDIKGTTVIAEHHDDSSGNELSHSLSERAAGKGTLRVS